MHCLLGQIRPYLVQPRGTEYDRTAPGPRSLLQGVWSMGGDFEIWNYQKKKIDAGGDDKLWIQFAPPKIEFLKEL